MGMFKWEGFKKKEEKPKKPEVAVKEEAPVSKADSILAEIKQGPYNHEASQLHKALGIKNPERLLKFLSGNCGRPSEIIEKIENAQGFTVREKMFMTAIVLKA